jgi:hypothetical protein
MVICGIVLTDLSQNLYMGSGQACNQPAAGAKEKASATPFLCRSSQTAENSFPKHRQRKIRTYISGATQHSPFSCTAAGRRFGQGSERSDEMNGDSGTTYQSSSNRPGGAEWHVCARGEPWKLVEILAMVLGFIVFWPIGLAVIGWKIWQRKSGYPGDIVTFGREKWRTNWGSSRWGFAESQRPSSSFASYPTGNRAFDEWRAAELARLEEERQRLAAAEREFADYMENLRHATDREEFERFMSERRERQGR